MAQGDDNGLRHKGSVPDEELIQIARNCFWTRAQIGSVDPVQEKQFFQLDWVDPLLLRSLILQARSRSFEECHAKNTDYVTSKWSGYRLAACVAYYLVSRWDRYIDEPAPGCRPDAYDYLGDFALPTEDGENTYVQVCAMDIAAEVIALTERVSIGTEPFMHITKPAMRFAESLRSMMRSGTDDEKFWAGVAILQPQLEAMGRIACGDLEQTPDESDHTDADAPPTPEPDTPTDSNEHQADTDHPTHTGTPTDGDQAVHSFAGGGVRSSRWRDYRFWLKYCAVFAVGVLVAAGAMSMRQAPTSSGQSPTTTTTTLTTTLSAAPNPQTGPIGAAPARSVVHNVTELVSATTTDGSQSSAAAPWTTTMTPLILDLYDNTKRGFVVTITLQTEHVQPEDVRVNLTLGKARGLNFSDSATYLTNKSVTRERQDTPVVGKPVELSIAGDRTATTYSTELYVNETQDPQQAAKLPQELAVFTCGVSMLTFEVLLAEDKPNSLNVTVPVPLVVVKRC